MVMDLYGMRAVLKFLSRVGVDDQGTPIERPVVVTKVRGENGDLSEIRFNVSGKPVVCWASMVKESFGNWVLYYSVRGVMKIAREANVFVSEGEVDILPESFVAIMNDGNGSFELWSGVYATSGLEVYRM